MVYTISGTDVGLLTDTGVLCNLMIINIFLESMKVEIEKVVRLTINPRVCTLFMFIQFYGSDIRYCSISPL